MVNICLLAFSACFSTLRGYGAYIISRVKTSVCWWGLIKLLPAGFCPISAGCNSKQNVILEGFIKLTVAGLCGGQKSNLWTLGAFVHPHKNLWLMWTMRVIKVSEPWHRWRVPVRHRRADDSWVQAWSGSYANPVPSVSGPLEIHRGTACKDISLGLFVCSRYACKKVCLFYNYSLHSKRKLSLQINACAYMRGWCWFVLGLSYMHV